MTATLMSPNGVATGFVYRRQWIWIDYPEPLSEVDELAARSVEGVDDQDAAPRPRFRPNPDYGPQTDDDGRVRPGFAVRVLCNPNGAEVRHERDLWAAVIASQANDDVDAYLQAIAPRVREWRAYGADDDGRVSPIPAPGECPDNPDQWQAFHTIPEDLMYWVIGQVRIAHLLRPDSPKARTAKASLTPSMPAGTTATPIPTMSDQVPEPPSS